MRAKNNWNNLKKKETDVKFEKLIRKTEQNKSRKKAEEETEDTNNKTSKKDK